GTDITPRLETVQIMHMAPPRRQIAAQQARDQRLARAIAAEQAPVLATGEGEIGDLQSMAGTDAAQRRIYPDDVCHRLWVDCQESSSFPLTSSSSDGRSIGASIQTCDRRCFA